VPPGVPRPVLPEKLETYGPVPRQIVEWGRAFKSMASTTIVYEGLAYKFVQEERSGASKSSRRYRIEAFERNGARIQPGARLHNVDQLVARGMANQAARETF